MEQVLLLNQDFSFLSTISWKRAMALMAKNKVEVVRYTDKTIRSERAETRIPKIVKLLYFIKKIYKVKMVYSKKVVFIRDGHTCAYCGSTDKLTIDHVNPRTKGGKTSYENVVACCWDCNNKKGDKTLDEARMVLKKRPYAPTVPDYLRMKMKDVEHILASL